MNAWFNNRHSKYVPPGGHVTDLCLSQLSVMGNFPAQAEFPLTILAEDEQVAKTFMQENPELKTKPVAGINPGAGFPTKLWSLERYAELADRLVSEMGFNILLTWGPGEEDMVREIASMMKQKSWTAPATTIAQSIGLYKNFPCLWEATPDRSIFAPRWGSQLSRCGDRLTLTATGPTQKITGRCIMSYPVVSVGNGSARWERWSAWTK